MTQHPHHKVRALIYQLDAEGRERITSTVGFTSLSSALAFETGALARLSVSRVDIVLLLRSSSRGESVTLATLPEALPC